MPDLALANIPRIVLSSLDEKKVRPEKVMELSKVLTSDKKQGQVQTQEGWLPQLYFLNH